MAGSSRTTGQCNRFAPLGTDTDYDLLGGDAAGWTRCVAVPVAQPGAAGGGRRRARAPARADRRWARAGRSKTGPPRAPGCTRTPPPCAARQPVLQSQPATRWGWRVGRGGGAHKAKGGW